MKQFLFMFTMRYQKKNFMPRNSFDRNLAKISCGENSVLQYMKFNVGFILVVVVTNGDSEYFSLYSNLYYDVIDV